MATKTNLPVKQGDAENLEYVFAKNATNDHGTFIKGQRARGAFHGDLVKTYVRLGILVKASKPAAGTE